MEGYDVEAVDLEQRTSGIFHQLNGPHISLDLTMIHFDLTHDFKCILLPFFKIFI